MIANKRSILIFMTVLLIAPSAVSQKPTLLKESPALWGFLAAPHSSKTSAAVILLHGSAGWNESYVELAKSLADSGFLALTVDYYAQSANDIVPATKHGNRNQYQATVKNAVEFLRSKSATPLKIGLVGFSQGAFLATATASSTPSVRAVVDFYGGIWKTDPQLEQQLKGFPPLLILHGNADTLARVRFAYELRDLVASHGGPVEMHIYPETPHSFFSQYSRATSDSVMLDALSRTVRFLRQHLSDRQ